MSMKKWIILGVVLAGGVGTWYYVSPKKAGITEKDFEFVTVEKGSIIQQVTASGKIQPINTVSVGTQVSGIVEEILVDYNDEVKEGQLLAKLDTSVLQETKNDAQAKLDLAVAKQKIAKLNYDRYAKLYKDNLIAKAVLEESEIELASADANVLSAQADFNKAKQNFGYASITSPVSGTVISKEVEQGQTVAASLSTPTLFKIAEDLTKMQIEANIAEADIGVITPGMPIAFTVDAYPNDKFAGTVKQIRLSPTEESNVVMYTVVMTVDNSSRKLLPGMTAFVTINIQEADNILKLPTMALQYKPSAAVKEQMNLQQIRDIGTDQAVLYQFKNGRIVPVVVQKGLSDMSSIEIVQGLNEGDKVILEAFGKKRK